MSAHWSATAGWRCLKFSLNDPVYYQYNYTATSPLDQTAAEFAALAVGDLDGDTTASDPWKYRGKMITAGVLRLATTMDEPTTNDGPEE